MADQSKTPGPIGSVYRQQAGRVADRTPGGVHNHGVEEGPRIGCREYLIGVCRLAAFDDNESRFREVVDRLQNVPRHVSPDGEETWIEWAEVRDILDDRAVCKRAPVGERRLRLAREVRDLIARIDEFMAGSTPAPPAGAQEAVSRDD